MKRHLHPLLQHPRSRFENAHAARRAAMPRNTVAGGSLRREDGYDWLRRIKQGRPTG
ncbi:MAG: hypothetical protein WBG81_15390 [Rhodanobacter sp.]|jgi:hypothetical protein|uniref:hypothetical protein n=1 Tax=Rhodanobacter sp. KK11 TaxID=3083255 RepID=UPI002966E9AD|nr:hypothetical protein [Rhodanobacter sp. KK11]MDW2981724.1 hypothetical protein [Rhodanobacter sp. KK11]